MAEGHKDYSGTPLWKKLGIRQGSRVVLAHAPPGFETTLAAKAPLPPEVTLLARASKDVDVAVLFVTERGTMARRFDPCDDRSTRRGGSGSRGRRRRRAWRPT